MDSRLLDHLVVEFEEHGKRAVGFLRTAHQLLELDSAAALPRLPETITYCLREAMKTIPASRELEGSGLWKTTSRAVTDARRRYLLVRGVRGEDEQGALDELLIAIDDLDLARLARGRPRAPPDLDPGHVGRCEEVEGEALAMVDREPRSAASPIRRPADLLSRPRRGTHARCLLIPRSRPRCGTSWSHPWACRQCRSCRRCARSR